MKNIKEVLDCFVEKNTIRDGIYCLGIFYSENERHNYSEIAAYSKVLFNQEEDKLDFIINKIERFKKNFETEAQKKVAEEELKKFLNSYKDNLEGDKKINLVSLKIIEYQLDKILDHLKLQHQNLSLQSEMETKLEQIKTFTTKTIENITTTVDNSKAELRAQVEISNEVLFTATSEFNEKVEQTEGKLNMGLISILGVFAAIIIAFFGGISSFADIFKLLGTSGVSILEVTFFAGITGFVVFNTVFVIIFFLAKLIGKDSMYKKVEGLGWWKSLWILWFNHYLFVTLYNMIMIIIMISSLVIMHMTK
jgi:hypothetical protein